MDYDYCITKKVLKIISDGQEVFRNQIKEAKQSLDSAKELGDLSENFAYDVALAKYNKLQNSYEMNEEYLENAYVATKEELQKTKMYKIVELKFKSLTSEPVIVKGILTPPIELKTDVPQIYTNSRMGQELLSKNESYWIPVNGDLCKVTLVGEEDSCFL